MVKKQEIINKYKISLEKSIKDIKKINKGLNRILNPNKTKKTKSPFSAYSHLIKSKNKKYQKAIYSHFSLGD